MTLSLNSARPRGGVRRIRKWRRTAQKFEADYRLLTEATGAVTFVCPPSGLHVAPQPKWMAFTGQSAAEMLGDGWTRAVHPDDASRAARLWQEAVVAGTPFESEHRIRRRDGAWRWMRVRAVPVRGTDGDIHSWFGAAIDVSEQRDSDLRLREASALLKSLFENAPVGLAVWDRDFRFVRINRALAAINGLSPEAHLGRRPDVLLPEIGGLEVVYERWRDILARGEPWRDVELRGATPADPGQERFWSEDFFPVRSDGQNVGIAAVVQDVTDRKRAEEALRASEARFRGLFQHAATAIAILDTEGRCEMCNPAVVTLTGFTEAELRGTDCIFLVHPDDRATTSQRFARFVAGEDTSNEGLVRFVRRDGTPRWAHLVLSALRDDLGTLTHVIALATDMSERKRHEDQVYLLLREVNHRAKNLLAVVDAMIRQTAKGRPEDFIERVERRIQALVASHDLLVSGDWRSVPLLELVRAQLAHLGDLADGRVVAQGPPLDLTAHAAQTLGMAFHELVTNALKYGALSVPAGQVTLSWEVTQGPLGPRFAIAWREHDGPPVLAPARRGFGSRVIGAMVEANLDCAPDLVFDPAGVRWRLACPAATILAGPVPPGFGTSSSVS